MVLTARRVGRQAQQPAQIRSVVDELRLVIFPVVLGGGERLFDETNDTKPLRLADSRTIGDGLVFVTYEVCRAAAN
jgi:riboflavin biosynthesis pyrimidine reductase